jgi:hypothetical protein
MIPRIFCVLCILGGIQCLGLDRNALTFTDYQLEVRIDPPMQLLEATGKVILRNNTSEPQRRAVLQISSTLSWKSITSAGKPLPYVAQPYTSDIDHTGSLTEAIVTLSPPVPPKATIELEIAYGGTIPADSTRLTRIGTPAEVASRTDWDRISESFTVVRGIGYVTWYPIATEAASLSEGDSVFQTIGAWKQRHAASRMSVAFSPGTTATLIANGARAPAPAPSPHSSSRRRLLTSYAWQPVGLATPTFVLGNYHTLTQPAATVFYLPGKESPAGDYARVATQVQPLVNQWFGAPREKLQIVELPEANASAWESGAMFFTPLKPIDQKSLELTLVHQLTHAAFSSPRAWIYEGVAHFSQALQREQQEGRKAALAYLEQQTVPLIAAEKQPLPDAPGRGSSAPPAAAAPGQSLITTTDELFYRTKAMRVWWMLRDMIGDQALQRTFQSYRADQDKEASYMQRLLQGHSHRDLEWFFDDWVYRDRGLPDFRIATAYPRALLPVDYSVTVTVENLGNSGAEVPVMVRAEQGEVTKRVEVRAREKAVVRLPIPAVPKHAIVNDGSVPESDTANNSAEVKLPEATR